MTDAREKGEAMNGIESELLQELETVRRGGRLRVLSVSPQKPQPETRGDYSDMVSMTDPNGCGYGRPRYRRLCVEFEWLDGHPEGERLLDLLRLCVARAGATP